jgi:hypothetical protein
MSGSMNKIYGRAILGRRVELMKNWRVVRGLPCFIPECIMMFRGMRGEGKAKERAGN